MSEKLSLGKSISKDALAKKLSMFISEGNSPGKGVTVERKSSNPEELVGTTSEINEDDGLTHQERINRINALRQAREVQKTREEHKSSESQPVDEKQEEAPVEIEQIQEIQQPILDITSAQAEKPVGETVERVAEKVAEKVTERTKVAIKEATRAPQQGPWSTHRKSTTTTEPHKLKLPHREIRFPMRSRVEKRKKPINLRQGIEIVIKKNFITVRELSELLSVPIKAILRVLRSLGESCNGDSLLKRETVELIALELEFNVVFKSHSVTIPVEETEDLKNLKERSPVVTIMGHIDHGKTTLLDAFRNSNIVKGESSGITQHIGAYQMKAKDGKMITFIDTPGHAAFTAMRMRGARVTDIVILVVAADDGVNEQTVEAIKHAKAAEVPIIVAVNKIDKNDANPQRVMRELIQHGLIVEEMGGDIMSVNISAKEKINLDKLEEAILLQADFLELKYDPTKKARGVVIESRMDKKCGAFATLLVQNGTLNSGDTIVVGESYGKIKGMVDSYNSKVKSAMGGMPVEVLGLNVAPAPGTEFFVVKSEKDAKAFIDSQLRERGAHETEAVKMEFDNDEKIKLNFIVKADVTGSIEAITESIKLLESDQVEIKIVHTAVGDINESDVLLSKVSNAYIIGFRVSSDKKIRENEKIIFHSVIYGVIESIKDLIKSMLAPEFEEVHLGFARVKEVFVLSDKSQIAGCYVTDGVINRSSKVRILRNSEPVRETTVKTLRKFKEEVREVKSGYECGILLQDFSDLKVGDIIEAFEIK